MAILVINSGSSSVKYGIFDLSEDGGELSRGIIDLSHPDHTGDRAGAIRQIFEQVRSAHRIEGIGHRVVHGGEAFRRPTRIERDVLAMIDSLHHLAPLHNPASTLGIEIALELAPEIPQVAVFDTTFSSTLPESAWRYALPRTLADTHQIRRYGFHGISHQFVATAAAQHLRQAPNRLRLISLHLGNGASATATVGGRCVETSMGMTPLEGLVMGTRAGDLDPSILIYLQQRTNLSADRLEQLLNRESGLRGLCGESDMRIIRQRARSGDAQARLAIDIFVHRVRKYIGAYTAVLGGLDGLVFTGGIGEHDADLRDEVCKGLAYLGIRLDPLRNADHATIISLAEKPPWVMVIPTNEELAIAQETQQCLRIR